MNFTGYAERAVELAVDLVNSHDPASGRDDLPDPATVAAWLEAHGVMPGRVGEADVEALHDIRASLRQVFEAPDERFAARAVNNVLRRCDARPELTDHDESPWHLHFAAASSALAERVGAQAAMGLAVVIALHGFDRLKVCHWESCRDVFVDLSRNRSRRFCSPALCGNRASAAAHRARRRAQH